MPSGGTTTAISVTTWLMRLVRVRTVPRRGAGKGASTRGVSTKGQPIFAAGRMSVVRVAVIGGGIAGLGAAYTLARAHEIELFERDERAGGHANTVVVDGVPLDTGFL